MKRKKEGPIFNYNNYIKKVNSQKDIENLVLVTREFLREAFKINYEYTFNELKEVIKKKKKILPEIQPKYMVLCEKFEHLEYRPSKPTKKEISRIKVMIKEVIKESMPSSIEEDRKTTRRNRKSKN